MNQAICLIRAHDSQEHLYLRVSGEALRDRTTKIFFKTINFRQSGTGDILFRVVRIVPLRLTRRDAARPDRRALETKLYRSMRREKTPKIVRSASRNDRIARFY